MHQMEIMPDSKGTETNYTTTTGAWNQQWKWKEVHIRVTQYLKYMFTENSQIGGQQQRMSTSVKASGT